MSNYESALEQARRLANSPEGQQLASLLQQTGGIDIQNIINQAAAGSLQQAKQAISLLLENPEAKKLMQQLGGGNG